MIWMTQSNGMTWNGFGRFLKLLNLDAAHVYDLGE